MGSLINFSDKSKKKSSKSLEHFLVWEFADVETLDVILKRYPRNTTEQNFYNIFIIIF